MAAVINTTHTHPHAHGYGEVPASSHSPDGHNIDPAIAGQDMMSGSAESGGDDSMNDGRKGGGKRELSQSKRAAQNRAAQVRTTCVAAELAIFVICTNICLELGKYSLDGAPLLCQFSCHPSLKLEAYIT